MNRLVLLLVCALGPCLSGVAQAQTPVRTTERQPLVQVTSDYAASEALAREWGLDAHETARYETLMRGPRGAFSVANLSPLEVLGIHAETPAERRAYADRLVALLYADTERVLAFERAVQAAWKRLGQPMLDPARAPVGTTPRGLDPGPLWGKRLAVFVALGDCPRCATRARELVRMSAPDGPLTGLDIYVVDTQDVGAIQAFARGIGVVPEAVARRRITLNHGETLYRQYLGADRDLPKVFLREADMLRPLANATTVAAAR